MPRISIIIPAYNVAPWLPDTLRSVQAQTLHDWECIIVDDGSTDAPDACLPANDRRFRLVRQENAGVSAARNRGLHEACGEYVAFLDGDDIWHPQALERLSAPLLQEDPPAFVWGNFMRFADGSGIARPSPLHDWKQTKIFWQNLLITNFLQFGALLFRAEKANGIPFDTRLRICEDRDWLIRLLQRCTTQHVPHIVHYYRQRAGSAVGNVEAFLKDEKTFLARYLEDPSVPEWVRRRARSAFLFHTAVLLAKLPGHLPQAVKMLLRAILTDPLYTENYLQPLRKLAIKMRGPEVIEELRPYLAGSSRPSPDTAGNQ